MDVPQFLYPFIYGRAGWLPSVFGGYVFYVNQKGGAYSHLLQTTEIPAHKHQIKTNNDDWNNSSGGGNFGTTHDGANGWANNNWYTENAGGGVAHNNMPPFLVVYMWRRVS